VRHFATRQTARLGRPVAFDAGAVQLLGGYGWPGNVRELANIVERLAILATGDTVTADDVARVVPQDGAPAAAPEAWSDVALVGRSRLPAGNAWRGDVAVRSGPVTVGGRVEGTLLVINGDAVLDPTAVITGDLIVVGGTVARARGAAVSGQVRVYQEPLAFRAKGDEIALVPPDLRRWFRNFGVEKSWGTADSRSSLTLATGGTFNRVEGLPVVFGPLFDWKLRRNLRLRVDALGVFRTAG